MLGTRIPGNHPPTCACRLMSMGAPSPSSVTSVLTDVGWDARGHSAEDHPSSLNHAVRSVRWAMRPRLEGTEGGSDKTNLAVYLAMIYKKTTSQATVRR